MDLKRMICIVLCIISVATPLVECFSFSTIFNRSGRDQEVFIKELDGIKKHFPHQHPFLWRLTQGAFLHHHSVNDNTEPAVFFLSHQHQRKTTECLAIELAILYAHNCNRRIAVFDGKDFTDKDAKMRLKQVIDAAYAKGACAIVVKDFDNIDPMSTLGLYYFFENRIQSYHNKAIIFTMDLYDSMFDEQQDIADYPLKWEPFVNDYLEDSLRSRSHAMNEDKTKALLSRVTPLVGFVKPESDCMLKCSKT